MASRGGGASAGESNEAAAAVAFTGTTAQSLVDEWLGGGDGVSSSGAGGGAGGGAGDHAQVHAPRPGRLAVGAKFLPHAEAAAAGSSLLQKSLEQSKRRQARKRRAAAASSSDDDASSGSDDSDDSELGGGRTRVFEAKASKRMRREAAVAARKAHNKPTKKQIAAARAAAAAKVGGSEEDVGSAAVPDAPADSAAGKDDRRAEAPPEPRASEGGDRGEQGGRGPAVGAGGARGRLPRDRRGGKYTGKGFQSRGGRPRKKTRSKQKNIKKDNRPLSERPSHLRAAGSQRVEATARPESGSGAERTSERKQVRDAKSKMTKRKPAFTPPGSAAVPLGAAAVSKDEARRMRRAAKIAARIEASMA